MKTPLKTEIQESWRNCKNFGIKTTSMGSNLILESEELQDLKLFKAILIEIAKPVMRELFEFIAESGFLITLSDERGFILEIFGDSNIIKEAENVNITIGSNWSEKHGGTNGIGTALNLRKPVQITGKEHYIKGLQSWSCSAAPIHDIDERVIGVLQISGPSYATHMHTLGMVVAAVDAIKKQIITEKKNHELTLVNSHLENIFYNISDGVLIFNSNFVCTHINSVAEDILNKEAIEIIDKRYQSIFQSKNTIKLNSLLSKGHSFADVEVVFETNKSSISSYLVSGDLMYDEKEEIIGIILFIKSINKINKIVNRFSGAQASFSFDDVIGESKEIKAAIEFAKAVAKTEGNVVLEGETGTGKEIFAQAIHNASSRRKGPFVAINCGALPTELIISELFGYVDGAFTGARKGGRPGKFELANGGTLFLDEIVSLNYGKQVSLLRAIQENKILRVGGSDEIPIDVRIIVAANQNLKSQVEKGFFREDLFYRLNVLTILLPPLRSRKGDIPLLFNHFFTLECKKLGKTIERMDKNIIENLKQYHWPGNIRELQNFAERMACSLNNESLPPVNLFENEFNLQSVSSINLLDCDSNKYIDLDILRIEEKEKKEEQEKEHIMEYLKQYGGNVTKVAQQMGVSRPTIYRKIESYGIHKLN